jgi:flagellar motor switch protein FliN
MNQPKKVHIKNLILKILPQLFNSMLNMEVTHSEPATEPEAGAEVPMVALDFSGDMTGLLRIRPSAEFARSMAAAKLGTDADNEPTAEEIQTVILEFTSAAADQIKAIMAEAGLSCDYSSARAQGATGKQNIPDDGGNLEQLFFQHGENQILTVDMALNMRAPDENTESAEKDARESLKDSPQRQAKLKAIQDFDLDLILDIPIELTVEIGRTKIPIHELLKLGPGSAVSLSKLESEPVDILANDTLIARGQVVVQDERYGIRVTEITSRLDRIKSLT